MSEKTRSLLGYAGVALAAAGVSHFVKPGIYQPVTTAAFPENTRRHVYTNGGIETALGLALAIDYTLLLLTRYREEVRDGRTREDAIVATMATAGRTVLFSAITVALALAGCAVTPPPPHAPPPPP